MAGPPAPEVAARLRRIKPVAGGRKPKEITLHNPAPLVLSQRRHKRNEAVGVPADHRLKHLDDRERSNMGVLQNSLRGIAQPEAANQNVGRRAVKGREGEPSECNFRRGEEARHQMLVTEHYFKHIGVQRQDAPPAQADRADGSRRIVQFLEQAAHAGSGETPAGAGRSPIRR